MYLFSETPPAVFSAGRRPIDIYWLYDLPNWLFELLIVLLFVIFSVAGLLASRRWMRGMHFQHSYNDIVGFYLAGIAERSA